MSDVFFTDMRTVHGLSQPQKLYRLIDKAGLGSIDMNNKFVAIKMHFGEPGNVAYLRPNWAKVVADYVRAHGGKPFLTDCNTLYVGRRKDALEHLEAAQENGFSPLTTGCQVIIADGLRGTDEAHVAIDGEYVHDAKIGKALYDADIIISLAHFKGHEQAGFGGAMKNLGMGGGSRAGKMEQHSAGKPSVDEELCIGCGRCTRECAQDAIHLVDRKSHIDPDKCLGCGHCIGTCNQNAINPGYDAAPEVLNYKIAEYAYAVVKDKPSFCINMVIDVSPNCDCLNSNDVPGVPDIGMFASFDPVALDTACLDAVNAAPVISDSLFGKCDCRGNDRFGSIHPKSHGMSQVIHAEKIGLGTREYTLKKI